MFRKSLSVLVLALALVSAVLLSGNRSALAAGPFVVTVNADQPDANPGDGVCKSASKVCTLRAAVEEADASAGPDTIYLKPGLTYTLTSQLMTHEALTIYGGGAANTIIDANGGITNSRAFFVSLGSLNLFDLTVQNGADSYGGAIVNQGTLTLERVTVRDSHVTNAGGGIHNLNNSTLVVNESMISSNSAEENGGGIYNRGTLYFYNSTVNGNTANNQDGGGVYNEDGAAFYLVNSTVYGNRAGVSGGGIFNDTTAQLEFSNTTVSANKADVRNTNAGDGAGFYNAGPLRPRGSIFVNNMLENGLIDTANDCGGFYIDEGYNYFKNIGTCVILTGKNTTVTDIDSKVSSLQDNGGPTLTVALQSNSPAIDAGNPNGCRDHGGNDLARDQRGFSRIVNGNSTPSVVCDRGASEYASPDPCTAKPGKPSLASPGNGSQAPREALLRWGAVTCATKYQVIVRQDSKKGPTVEKKNILTAYHITKKLNKNVTYFWKVKACNTLGCAASSWYSYQAK